MESYATILIDRQDGVATITLNRPEKRNAMNPTLSQEMLNALTWLETDPATSIVVITGAGPTFSSGMDLKEYFQDVPSEAQRNLNRRITNDWVDRLLRMYAKPTIAMVNGGCFGGAFTIVASCDFAIAADDAQFALTEVNWGALPAGMVSKAIATLMPYRAALYYALTAERFDGRKAAELQFVNRSVPLEHLHENVLTLARHLQTLDAAALRSTKEAFRQVVEMNYEQAYWWLMAKSNELHWRHAGAGRAEDGIQGFLDKKYRPADASFKKPGESG